MVKEPHWMRGVKWSCTVCGKAPPCRCWVRLTCERCSATTDVPRFEEAGDLDVVETLCPKCRP